MEEMMHDADERCRRRVWFKVLQLKVTEKQANEEQ